MPNQFIYAIDPGNKLLWYRHLGVSNGIFNWQGPHQVGQGWQFKHVFSGGNGIIYAITKPVEATVQITGHTTPASGGDLLWYRHIGQADGSFRWEGPKKVGTGWGHFEHVFYGGNGIIYAVEPKIEASVQINGTTSPTLSGKLLWFHHIGREDGSFRWEGSKTVGSGWSGFEHVFSGGDGIIYLIEPFVEATVNVITGRTTPASGGKLRWYRHQGQADGSFRWEGPKIVGSGWSGLKNVFSADDGIIYYVEPVVEATLHLTGRSTPATGGNLRWQKHLGREDGTFRWEGPKVVGNGWGNLLEVFSGGGDKLSEVANNIQRFCGFPDPPQGVGIHTTAYTLKEKRRKLLLTWAVISGLPNLNIKQIISAAFAVWKAQIPALTFVFVDSAFTNAGSPTNPAVDITLNTGPLSSPAIGSTAADGSSITFDTITSWVPKNPTPSGSQSLLAVAIHEIGHAIGLLHTTTDNTIMNPFNGNIEVLTADDINGARMLYGWEGQRLIPNKGSDCGPSICSCGNVLAMAWKGIKNDSSIYYATSLDGVNWTDQKVVVGVGTTDSPSLAWDGALLWMAWTGIHGDSSLFYAKINDPANWPANPGLLIPDVGSSNGPSLVMTPSPLLVWKGINNDSGIFFSSFDVHSGKWSPQQHVGDIGSSDRPAVIMDVSGETLMVWKGIEGDSNLWSSTKNAIGWQQQQIVSWNVPGNGGAGIIATLMPGTSCGPGIATDGSRVFIAWRGAGNDSGIWFTQRAKDVVSGINTIAWSSQGNIPEIGTSHRPGIAFFAGRIHLVWKGVNDDTTLWMARL